MNLSVKLLQIILCIGWFNGGMIAMQHESDEEMRFFMTDHDEYEKKWAASWGLACSSELCAKEKKDARVSAFEKYQELWCQAQRTMGFDRSVLLPVREFDKEYDGAFSYCISRDCLMINTLHLELKQCGVRWFTLLRAAAHCKMGRHPVWTFGSGGVEVAEEARKDTRFAEFEALCRSSCSQCLFELADDRSGGSSSDRALAESRMPGLLVQEDDHGKLVNRSLIFSFCVLEYYDGFDTRGYLEPWVLLVAAHDLKRRALLCDYHSCQAH